MRLVVISMVLLSLLATTSVVANDIRCFSPTSDVTICRNSKGETVKTIIQGQDGTFTVTTKKGTVRCFTMNGTVVCR